MCDTDTPHVSRQGGSSFNERTCPMSIAPHNVEALSPEAFASLAESPFPCAPRYGREVVWTSSQDMRPSMRRVCALIRDSTLHVLEFFDTFTLVLLPKGALYFGTRRNTIQLSRVLLFSSSCSRENRKCAPAGAGFSSPCVRRRGLQAL